jgi:hypothetical protein
MVYKSLELIVGQVNSGDIDLVGGAIDHSLDYAQRLRVIGDVKPRALFWVPSENGQ